MAYKQFEVRILTQMVHLFIVHQGVQPETTASYAFSHASTVLAVAAQVIQAFWLVRTLWSCGAPWQTHQEDPYPEGDVMCLLHCFYCGAIQSVLPSPVL